MSEDIPSLTEEQKYKLCQIQAEMVPEEDRLKALTDAYIKIDSLGKMVSKVIENNMAIPLEEETAEKLERQIKELIRELKK
jgi:hypothetical protein